MVKKSLLTSVIGFFWFIIPLTASAHWWGYGLGSVALTKVTGDQIEISLSWTLLGGTGLSIILPNEQNMVNKHDRVLINVRLPNSEYIDFPDENGNCKIVKTFVNHLQSAVYGDFIFFGKSCLSEFNKLAPYKNIRVLLYEIGNEHPSDSLAGLDFIRLLP